MNCGAELMLWFVMNWCFVRLNLVLMTLWTFIVNVLDGVVIWICAFVIRIGLVTGLLHFAYFVCCLFAARLCFGFGG